MVVNSVGLFEFGLTLDCQYPIGYWFLLSWILNVTYVIVPLFLYPLAFLCGCTPKDMDDMLPQNSPAGGGLLYHRKDKMISRICFLMRVLWLTYFTINFGK
jgi:hypothetical protein